MSKKFAKLWNIAEIIREWEWEVYDDDKALEKIKEVVEDDS